MMWRRLGATAVVAVTAVVTVTVFVLFDRGSHSASDTLRPFMITIAPVWLLAGLAFHRLTRRRGKGAG